MKLNFLHRAALVLLLFVTLAPSRAAAGKVYLYLAQDPSTTAGFGISTIPRDFSNGTFSVTSTLSGAGKWHLYALDDVEGSLGLAGFSIRVNNASGHLNRSPNATYTNYGDNDETVIDSTGQAGFSDALVRSGVGHNPSNPVQGNQVIGSLQDIAGIGQTAGNFNNVPNNPAPGDHRVWGGVTSGQWGNYATDPSPINGKNWLFLGEGNYTGGAPTLGSIAINHYDSANPLHQTPLDSGSIQIVANCLACYAPTIQDVVVNNVNANDPGLVSLTMSLVAVPPPPISPRIWDNFRFDSYVPAGGASGTGPTTPATFNTTSREFSWNTIGSPLGTYKWLVDVRNDYGSDTGSITVHVTAVPEPAAISLLAFALAASLQL